MCITRRQAAEDVVKMSLEESCALTDWDTNAVFIFKKGDTTSTHLRPVVFPSSSPLYLLNPFNVSIKATPPCGRLSVTGAFNIYKGRQP